MNNDEWAGLTDREQRLECLKLAQEMEIEALPPTPSKDKGREVPWPSKVVKRAKAYFTFVEGKGVEKPTKLELVHDEPRIIFTLDDDEEEAVDGVG